MDSLVNDTNSNIIKIFGICDSTNNKYEIQKNPNKIENTLTSNISTIIQTTIPTSIITNIPATIPSSTFTNIPTTILTSIDTKIQASINTTISTTIPVYIPNKQSEINKINQNELIIIQQKSTKTKEEIIDNLNLIVQNYDIGKIYEIFGNDYNIKISPIHSNEYKNISTYIDFSNCENLLRKENKLPSSSILTVYQIEIDNLNEQSLINNVEYAVFDENKKMLDLSVCENEVIEIKYQLNITLINMTKINYYSDLGIDVFNIKDDFFNDICYPYSEDDSDMILKDRLSYIYENYSVCENNCQYNKINLTEKIVSCKCNIKIKIDQDVQPPRLAKIIRDSFTDSKFAVILCYNLVFDFKNKKNNLGFILFSILVIIHIPIYIHYFIFKITPIKKYIVSEMNKYGYFCNVINPIKRKENKIMKIYNEEDKIKINKKIKNHQILKLIGKEERISKENSSNIKLSKIDKNITINNNGKIIPTYKSLKSKLNTNISNLKNKKNKKKKNLNKHQSLKNSILLYNYKIVNKNYINVFNGKKRKNSMNNLRRQINNKKITSKYSYSLIQIDANNSICKQPNESYIILDNYNYEIAIKYDKRSFWRIFYICILAKENIINILFFRTPLDLQSLRICLFIFVYSCDLAFNTIFYSNESISEKYHYEGNNLFLFNLVNNLIQSIISSIISMIIVNIFQYMIGARGDFEDIFKDEEKKLRENRNYKVNKVTKVKILEHINKIYAKLQYMSILFVVLEFLIMLFFYYFVTAFCEVYKNTQISWLYDFFISFLISFATEIFGSFFLAIFYIISIKYKNKYLYKIVIFFYNL